MRTSHSTMNLSIRQVSRAASAPGSFDLWKTKSPGADAARLAKSSLRRGASLIELMVVIAVITVLFGMVGVVFHRMFLSEQVAMRAALTERAISRLADQFRHDVHSTNAAIPEVDDGTIRTLKLVHAETDRVQAFPAIVYSIRDDEVTREQFGTEGKPLSREVYRLPECRVSFPDQTEEMADHVMIRLAIERQGSTITPQPQATRPWRSLAIEAILSRDDRLVQAFTATSPAAVKEESK